MAKPRTPKPRRSTSEIREIKRIEQAAKQAAKRIGVRVNLPLREDLHRKLEQAAAGHQFTLTNEIRIRLEDSFDRDIRRRYEDILRDMEINWARFSTRFLRIDLAEQLAEEVMRGEPPEKLRTLAGQILKHGEVEQRSSGGVS